MRVVFDTNTFISAVISPNGAPRRLLNEALKHRFSLYTSPILLAELLDVLERPKFSARLVKAHLTPAKIVHEIRNLAFLVIPQNVAKIILADPDDDHVLACAVVAQANMIVSGDQHLLALGEEFQDIQILNSADALRLIQSET